MTLVHALALIAIVIFIGVVIAVLWFLTDIDDDEELGDE